MVNVNLVFYIFIQLLGEILLNRHNFVAMTKYISNPENLKLMMNLLRDKSRNIQFEAFHVFKVRNLVFFSLRDTNSGCVLNKRRAQDYF